MPCCVITEDVGAYISKTNEGWLLNRRERHKPRKVPGNIRIHIRHVGRFRYYLLVTPRLRAPETTVAYRTADTELCYLI